MGRNRTRKRRQQQHHPTPPIETDSGLFEARPFAALTTESARSAPVGFAANGHSLSRISPTVQAKLTVGAAHDPYEQQADQTAATVVSRLNSPTNLQPAAFRRRKRRRLEAAPLSIQPLSESGPQSATPANSKIERGITSRQGKGRPLEGQTRNQMEGAFGHSFESVNIHTDSNAHRLNQSLNSLAFTTGEDIFFRQGAYQPTQASGQELLAHELTHVVQQGGSTRIQRRLMTAGEFKTLAGGQGAKIITSKRPWHSSSYKKVINGLKAYKILEKSRKGNDKNQRLKVLTELISNIDAWADSNSRKIVKKGDPEKAFALQHLRGQVQEERLAISNVDQRELTTKEFKAVANAKGGTLFHKTAYKKVVYDFREYEKVKKRNKGDKQNEQLQAAKTLLGDIDDWANSSSRNKNKKGDDRKAFALQQLREQILQDRENLLGLQTPGSSNPSDPDRRNQRRNAIRISYTSKEQTEASQSVKGSQAKQAGFFSQNKKKLEQFFHYTLGTKFNVKGAALDPKDTLTTKEIREMIRLMDQAEIDEKKLITAGVAPVNALALAYLNMPDQLKPKSANPEAKLLIRVKRQIFEEASQEAASKEKKKPALNKLRDKAGDISSKVYTVADKGSTGVGGVGTAVDKAGKAVSKGGEFASKGGEFVSKGGEFVSKGGEFASKGGSILSKIGGFFNQSSGIFSSIASGLKNVVGLISTLSEFDRSADKGDFSILGKVADQGAVTLEGLNSCFNKLVKFIEFIELAERITGFNAIKQQILPIVSFVTQAISCLNTLIRGIVMIVRMANEFLISRSKEVAKVGLKYAVERIANRNLHLALRDGVNLVLKSVALIGEGVKTLGVITEVAGVAISAPSVALAGAPTIVAEAFGAVEVAGGTIITAVSSIVDTGNTVIAAIADSYRNGVAQEKEKAAWAGEKQADKEVFQNNTKFALTAIILEAKSGNSQAKRLLNYYLITDQGIKNSSVPELRKNVMQAIRESNNPKTKTQELTGKVKDIKQTIFGR